jgi:group I intron endonuclease
MKKAIYKITNNINDKIYIGQSNNPDNRWKSHCSDSRNNVDIGKSAIHDAMRSLGIEHFRLTVIGWFEGYNDKEKYYIQQYNSLVPNGYNIEKGGNEPPHKYGEEHHNSSYKQELIDNIIDDLLSHKYTQKQIENKYQVNQQLVTSINRGITHRRAGVEYPIIKTSNYHCNEDVFEEIYFLLKNSVCTCSEIGKYYGFSASTVKAINSGRNHYCENIQYPIRNFRGKANSQSVEAILAKRSTETIDTSLEM